MPALETLVAEKPPLQRDEDGVFRVGGTRVRLDTVVSAFQNGCTAEEILLKYSSLTLKDIYSVLTYYLQHQADVEAYLAERRMLIEQTEREIEAHYSSLGVRERLLSRRKMQA